MLDGRQMQRVLFLGGPIYENEDGLVDPQMRHRTETRQVETDFLPDAASGITMLSAQCRMGMPWYHVVQVRCTYGTL
jgi:hypothetical protein